MTMHGLQHRRALLACPTASTFSPYGPTQGVPNPASNNDDNSITFTWGTTASNGRADHRLRDQR